MLNEKIMYQEPIKQIRYVRVTGVLKNKFIEFDFSIGTPTLYVELILPFKQFSEFCIKHDAQELSTEQIHQVDIDKLKWRYGQIE